MLRKFLIILNFSWVIGLTAFCWSKNVSLGGLVFTAVGTTLRDLDLPRAAAASYSAALYFVPNAGRIHSARGYAYILSEHYDDAIASYNTAIQIDGAKEHLNYNRGIAYARIERSDQAITDYTTAIALNPDCRNCFAARADAYLKAGKFVDAIADYDNVIEFNPSDVGAFYGRARAKFATGQNRSALADAQRAIRIAPRGPYSKDARMLVRDAKAKIVGQPTAPSRVEQHGLGI